MARPDVLRELLIERVVGGQVAADGDAEDLDQRVLANPLDARVVQTLEMVVERSELAAAQDDDPSGRGRRGSVPSLF